uniref:Uncharacterized protein n=1 Tax=Electrophorus electricus TaxID=8005 RepID=A0AAY5EE56_ELEEL
VLNLLELTQCPLTKTPTIHQSPACTNHVTHSLPHSQSITHLLIITYTCNFLPPLLPAAVLIYAMRGPSHSDYASQA